VLAMNFVPKLMVRSSRVETDLMLTVKVKGEDEPIGLLSVSMKVFDTGTLADLRQMMSEELDNVPGFSFLIQGAPLALKQEAKFLLSKLPKSQSTIFIKRTEPIPVIPAAPSAPDAPTAPEFKATPSAIKRGPRGENQVRDEVKAEMKGFSSLINDQFLNQIKKGPASLLKKTQSRHQVNPPAPDPAPTTIEETLSQAMATRRMNVSKSIESRKDSMEQSRKDSTEQICSEELHSC